MKHRSLLLAFFAVPAAAAPTMVRLGYANCVACHVSPQGAGLLTVYGRGVDEAQSLRAGEYAPSEAAWVRALNLEGRVQHDLRLLGQAGISLDGAQRPYLARLIYRNATSLDDRHRVSLLLSAELTQPTPASPSYARASRPGPLQVARAMWEFRPTDGVEIALGRDALPSGLNVADLGAFFRARNRQAYGEYPTQAKLFLWSDKNQLTAYAFGPTFHEARARREFGAGAVAETDVGGDQKKILGLEGLGAFSSAGNRQVIGGFARLGFDGWGIFAAHDLTLRQLEGGAAFVQNASYLQGFWAAKEWLVLFLTAEHLLVGAPFQEQSARLRPEIFIRWTASITTVASVRYAYAPRTGQSSVLGLLTLALKTVD